MDGEKAERTVFRGMSRRQVISGAAVASIAASLGYRSLLVGAASPATKIFRGPVDKPVVSLTFDGGSDRGYCGMILDTLANNGIKGTFPMTGEYALANPDLIKRIVDEGHQLVNHTYSHPSFTGVSSGNTALTYSARFQQLESTEETFINAAGVGSRPYFRPPYGDYDNGVLADLGEARFSYCVLWSLDVLGWNGLTQNQIVSRVLNDHGNGYIYLMHVGSESQEGPALQRIIDGLRNRGYGFATVSDLIGGTAPPPAAAFNVGDTVRVTSGLYLRTSPNFGGTVITTMPTGTICTVLGGPSPADGHSWYQLQTPYGNGWASAVSLVKTTPPTPPPPPAFSVGDTVRVKSALYLRTNPNLGSGVITTMPTGTTCTVLAGPSPSGGYNFYQVQSPYGIGWAAGEHMEKTSAPPPSPTPTPTSTPTPGPPSDTMNQRQHLLQAHTPTPTPTPNSTSNRRICPRGNRACHRWTVSAQCRKPEQSGV